jgi:hypothetical protein
MPPCSLHEAAEEAAALAVRATFAPLVGSMSLLRADHVMTDAGPAHRGKPVRAWPDEVRRISETASALRNGGEGLSEVSVRLYDTEGAVVAAIDYTWRLARRP